MQVSLSNHKSTESAIKNLEVQVGELAEKSIGNFVANTEKNPKKECKIVLTKSQTKENVEKEKRVEGALEDVNDEEGEDTLQKEAFFPQNFSHGLIPSEIFEFWTEFFPWNSFRRKYNLPTDGYPQRSVRQKFDSFPEDYFNGICIRRNLKIFPNIKTPTLIASHSLFNLISFLPPTASSLTPILSPMLPHRHCKPTLGLSPPTVFLHWGCNVIDYGSLRPPQGIVTPANITL